MRIDCFSASRVHDRDYSPINKQGYARSSSDTQTRQCIHRIFIALMLLLGSTCVVASVNSDGSFSTSITIESLPAVGGAAPPVILTYNSGSGDGVLGRGWTLTAAPSIQRLSRDGGLKYAADDLFADVDGVLVEARREGDSVFYRSENANLNLYEADMSCPDGPCSWTVVDRIGGTFLFGENGNSRVLAAERSNASIGWHLSSYRDRFGNGYDIQYDNNVSHLYVSEIRFNLHEEHPTLTRIKFDYEDRPDPRVFGRDGELVHQVLRLESVRVYVGDSLLRQYAIKYVEDLSHSVVAIIEEVDSNAEAKLSTDYSYEANSDFFTSTDILFTDGEETLPVNEKTNLLLRDFTGDGLLDFIYAASKRNIIGVGNGASFSTGTVFAEGIDIQTNRNVEVGDFNGDGRTDLLLMLVPGATLFFGDENGLTEGAPAFGDIDAPPSIYATNGSYGRCIGDFDGDGNQDLFAFSKNAPTNKIYLSDGLTFNAENAIDLEATAPFFWPNENTSILCRDIDGDGLLDILRLGTENANANQLWLSPGRRRGETSIQITEDGDPLGQKNVYLTDTNGDSLLDILVLSTDSSAVHVFDGNAYQKLELDKQRRPVIAGNKIPIPPSDFNGDGMLDYLELSGNVEAVPNRLLLWTGDGFVEYEKFSLKNEQIAGPGIEFRIGEFDRDGASDVLLMKSGEDAILLLSKGGLFEKRIFQLGKKIQGSIVDPLDADYDVQSIENIPIFKSSNPTHRPVLSDIDTDGVSEVLVFTGNNTHFSLQSQINSAPKLVGIKSIDGSKMRIEYGNVRSIGRSSREPLHCGEEGNANWQQHCGLSDYTNRTVVKQIDAWDGRDDDPVAGDEQTSFYYEDSRFHPGRGRAYVWAGFGLFSKKDLKRQSTEEEYAYQSKLLAGLTRRTEAVRSNELLSVAEDFQYQDVNPSDEIQLIVPNEHVVTVYDESGPFSISRTNITYDEYGYAKKITDCSGRAINVDDPSYDCVTTENIYTHEIDKNRYGRLDATQQTVSEVASSGYGGEYVDTVLSWIKYRYFESGTFAGELEARQELNCSNALKCKNDDDFRWVTVSTVKQYDSFGNVIQVENSVGSIFTSEYDDRFPHSPKWKENGEGLRTSYSYDNFGRLSVVRDPNGSEIGYKYDSLGRRSFTENPDGGWVRTKWLNRGNPIEQYRETTYLIEAGYTGWQREYFDGFGFSYKTVQVGLDNKEITTLRSHTINDDGGFTERVSEPFYADEEYRWFETRYDDLGRRLNDRWVVSIDDGFLESETTVNIEYIGRDFARISDGRPNVTVEVYDYAGRTLGRFKADPSKPETEREARIDYVYDPTGRVTKLTLTNLANDEKRSTDIVYDTLGRKRSVTDNISGTWSADYYDDGKLLSTRDNFGRTVGFAYNKDGQIKQKKYSALFPEIKYEYGTSEDSGNTVGRIKRIKDGHQTATYEYDAIGRITVVRSELADFPESIFEQRFFYDKTGKLVRKMFPDGTFQQYEMDIVGHTRQVLVNGQRFAAFDDFNAKGQYSVRTIFSNPRDESANVRTSYEYVNGRLDRVKTSDTDGNTLQNLGYSFNPHGDVAAITDLRKDDAKTIGDVNTSQTQSFGYDNLGRLDRAESKGVYGVKSFSYNAFGDVETFGGTTARSLEYDWSGDGYRIYDDNFEAIFDRVGDIKKKTDGHREWNYQFGPEHRLVQVESGNTVTSFSYSHTGIRLIKASATNGGSRQKTYYISPTYEVRTSSDRPGVFKITKIIDDGRSQILASMTSIADSPRGGSVPTAVEEEIADSGASVGMTQLSFPFAMRDLAEQSPTLSSLSDGPPVGTWFYHLNHIGSVALVTDTSGNVVNRLSYLPFGEIVESSTIGDSVSSVGFTGQELDRETGLLYLEDRYYDPSIGRFISPDSVVPNSRADIESFNRYAYAHNNPISYSDPSGNWNVFKAVRRLAKTVGKTIERSVRRTAKAIENAVKTFGRNPIKALTELPIDVLKAQESAARQAFMENSELRTIGMIAAGVYGGPGGAAAFSAYMTYSATGDLETSLRAGAITYVTAAAFAEIGSIETNGMLEHTGKAIAMGNVGAMSAAAQGGDPKDGFINAFGASLFSSTLQESTRAKPTYESGKDLPMKGGGFTIDDLEMSGKNLGIASDLAADARGTWALEGSDFMLGVNKVPGMNSLSYFHDYFVGALPNTLQTTPIVQVIFNQGTIIPVGAVNYYALGVSRDRYLLDRAMEKR